MDWIHVQGINLIHEIQSQLKNHKESMLWMSHFGNPRNAFLLFFPIAFHLNYSAGVRILWLASLAEWINAIFKWLLHGERPYWWIHETEWYQNDENRVLEQYHITCETGPGSPSGHAMVTAAVLLTLVRDVIQPALAEIFKSRHLAGLMSWLGYSVVLCLVCISRCFIAAHFPHQVICGTFAGILLAWGSYRFSLGSISLLMYIVTPILLLFFGLVIFLVVKFAGVDPLWSLELAQKWCQNKDWIHLDTTLFAAIIRDASCLLGLGLGLKLVGEPTSSELWVWRVMAVVCSLFLTQGSQFTGIPQESPLFFYTMLSFIYIVLIAVVVSVPKVILFVVKPNANSRSKFA